MNIEFRKLGWKGFPDETLFSAIAPFYFDYIRILLSCSLIWEVTFKRFHHDAYEEAGTEEKLILDKNYTFEEIQEFAQALCEHRVLNTCFTPSLQGKKK